MKKYIKPLYIKAYLNGKPFSKVLVDNRLVVNIMPLRLFPALGKRKDNLIAIDVVMSVFIGEITKAIRVLLVEITIGNKKCLSIFFW